MAVLGRSSAHPRGQTGPLPRCRRTTAEPHGAPRSSRAKDPGSRPCPVSPPGNDPADTSRQPRRLLSPQAPRLVSSGSFQGVLFEAFVSGLQNAQKLLGPRPWVGAPTLGPGPGPWVDGSGRRLREGLQVRPGCRLVSSGPLQGDLFEAFVSGALQSRNVDRVVGMAERAHARDGAGLRTEEMVEGGSHEKRRPQPGTPWRRWWSPRAGNGGRGGTKAVRSRATQPRGGPTNGGIVGSPGERHQITNSSRCGGPMARLGRQYQT